MYKVIRAFRDSQDNNRLYNVGDSFPADGVKVSKTRAKSLLDGANKNGKVYLEEIADDDGEGGREGNAGDNPGENADGKTEN